jgi:hypothetical protein
MAKTFLMATSSSNENYSGDCDIASVVLNDYELEQLAMLRNIWLESLERFPEVVQPITRLSLEITFFLAWPDFHSYGVVEDMFVEPDNIPSWMKSETTEVEQALVEALRCERVECTRVNVTQDGVYWTTIPKHSDVLITTAELSWEELGLTRP